MTKTNEISPYYGCNVVLKNDNIQSMRLYFRWDQSHPIEDILESLNNFEQIQISIDNRTLKID
jgi:hypothetical protein